MIKPGLTAFGIPTSVKLAPGYATYLADIYQGDHAVGFWPTSVGPSAYSTFNRIYGTNEEYIHQRVRPPWVAGPRRRRQR